MPDSETVGSLGETRVLELIGRWVGVPPEGVGFGDDAAVVPTFRGPTMLTTDVMVENVHFKTRWCKPEEVGFKVLAANLSDAAAMGGEASHALVSLVLPPSTRVEAVKRFYRGLMRLARKEGVAVVGGNLSAGKEISATVMILGSFPRGEPLLRTGARPGDAIYVTGQPGLARAGYLLMAGRGGLRSLPDLWIRFDRESAWRSKLRRKAPGAGVALRRFLVPEPRVHVPRSLSLYRPTALVDVSDGLASDLHLLTGAGRGAEIEEPLLRGTPAFQKLASALGESPVEIALRGGEDYELLITVPYEASERLGPSAVVAGTPLTRIGRIVGRRGVRLRTADGVRSIERAGYEHFQSRKTSRRRR